MLVSTYLHAWRQEILENKSEKILLVLLFWIIIVRIYCSNLSFYEKGIHNFEANYKQLKKLKMTSNYDSRKNTSEFYLSHLVLFELKK